MLQYLIVLLDDTSISFCHYENERVDKNLIALSDLEKVILFSLKRNLTLQFIYPDYVLPQEYNALIETVPHGNIVSSNAIEKGSSDVVVINDWKELQHVPFDKTTIYVWRTSKDDFFNHCNLVVAVLEKVIRLNIIITDFETFDEKDFDDYQKALSMLSDYIEKLYLEKRRPQLNLLTDRMILGKMNNCNAGCESITLAPNGKFYVCPAFYYRNVFSLGDLEHGLEIKNSQLYRIDHAPLCRNCDAYQCRRCIWLNYKTTKEVNIPSREQCVVAHLERNMSKKLLENIHGYGIFLPSQEIKEIDYLDPFDVRKEW